MNRVDMETFQVRTLAEERFRDDARDINEGGMLSNSGKQFKEAFDHSLKSNRSGKILFKLWDHESEPPMNRHLSARMAFGMAPGLVIGLAGWVSGSWLRPGLVRFLQTESFRRGRFRSFT